MINHSTLEYHVTNLIKFFKWPCHVTDAVFLPITCQGSILTLRHVG